MAGLAVWLLVLDFNKLANRGFALFLVFRAGQMATGAFRGMATDAADVAYVNNVVPYILIPIVPSIVYFAACYPRRRGFFSRRAGAWTLIAFTLLAELAYLLDHSLFATIEAGRAPSSLMSAGRGFYYADFGPLILFNALVLPAMGILAFRFARDYVAAEPGSGRYSAFLIFAGFALNALFDGTYQLMGLVEHLNSGAHLALLPWGWAFLLLPSLTLFAALAAVLEVLFRGLHPMRGKTDPLSTMFLVVAILPILVAVLLGVTDANGLSPLQPTFFSNDPGTNALYSDMTFFAILGLWRLGLPILVAYALVRYHLFGIDVKAKATIQYGVIAAAITLSFFFAGEFTERFFSDRHGPLVGLTAAGVLTFAFRPLERVGERIAHQLMPGVKPIHRLTPAEKRSLFQEQFALAMQDGMMTAKERLMLQRLQRRLGIVEVTAGGGRGGSPRPSRR